MAIPDHSYIGSSWLRCELEPIIDVLTNDNDATIHNSHETVSWTVQVLSNAFGRELANDILFILLEPISRRNLMLGKPESVFTEKTFVEIGSVYMVEQWLSCPRLQETCWIPGIYRLRTSTFFRSHLNRLATMPTEWRDSILFVGVVMNSPHKRRDIQPRRHRSALRKDRSQSFPNIVSADRITSGCHVGAPSVKL
jgi:hypothetical protein